jgi:PAS domain S-box-containing protein
MGVLSARPVPACGGPWARRAIPCCFGLLGILLAGYLASLLMRREGQVFVALDTGLTSVVQIGASVLCLARARTASPQRLAVLSLGFGLLVWSVGDLVWGVVGAETSVGQPSVADALYLGLYPSTFLSFMLFIRGQARHFPASAWLDGLLGGLSLAAIIAAFRFDRVLGTVGRPAAVLVNLAYPIGDVILLALSGAAFVLSIRRSAQWSLLAAGCMLFGTSDTVYLMQLADGRYREGTLLDIGWPLAIVVMSGAVWLRGPDATRTIRLDGGALLIPPGFAFASGLGILVYGNLRHLGRVTLILAAATLLTAMLRALLSLRDLRALPVERRLRTEAEAAQRRLAEQVVRNRELAVRLNGLLDAAPVGIIETDLRHRVVRWNPASESIYGWLQADVLGRPDPTAAAGDSTGFDDDDDDRACDRDRDCDCDSDSDRDRDCDRDVSVRHVRRDGSPVDVELSQATLRDRDGRPTGVIKIVTDVTRRKELEIIVRHGQRLESVGRLAAGIAHEINTPIQFIGDNVRFMAQSCADLIRLHGAYGDVLGAGVDSDRHAVALAAARTLESELDADFIIREVSDACTQALDGVDRVATIVRAMQAFGSPDDGDKATISLNDAITNTLIVAGNELSHIAEVRTDFAELPMVRCHPGDINQVVLNLVINAAHAIAAASGRDRGVILLADDGVVIEVADTGAGIAPEIADRIFDPFFTTKDVGAGTGQGLALVRSLVVDRHDGRVTFSTELGVGTTFTVYLPQGDPDSQPGDDIG